LVTRVHNEAIKYNREGKKVILVGHKGHAEVRGTMGQAPMFLVDDHTLTNIPEWHALSEIAVLTQTTLSIDDTEKAVTKIKKKFPNALVRNDVCYATTNRQEAVKKLAAVVDLVLVMGSENSSNCNRLREVAEKAGVPAYLINNVAELDPGWLIGINRVGITSGASTPEVLIDEMITKIGPEAVSTLKGVEENVTFTLPKEL